MLRTTIHLLFFMAQEYLELNGSINLFQPLQWRGSLGINNPNLFRCRQQYGSRIGSKSETEGNGMFRRRNLILWLPKSSERLDPAIEELLSLFSPDRSSERWWTLPYQNIRSFVENLHPSYLTRLLPGSCISAETKIYWAR